MSSFNFSTHMKDYYRCKERLGSEISEQMLDSISQKELFVAAKKLHLLHKNTVMCGSEIESDVLAEFALFSHLHRFGSAALRWCSRQKAPSSALDKRIFAGVQTSFYSVFMNTAAPSIFPIRRRL